MRGEGRIHWQPLVGSASTRGRRDGSREGRETAEELSTRTNQGTERTRTEQLKQRPRKEGEKPRQPSKKEGKDEGLDRA